MTPRRFLMLAFLGAATALAGLWVARSVSAEELILTVSVPRVLVGEEQGASLEAGDMSANGLGAWTIDVAYDPDLLEPTLCDVGSLAVCNLDYAEGTVRVAGASTETFPPQGSFYLASVWFECLAPGEAELTLVPRILVDQTLGDPQPIDATVQSASFVCEEAAAPAVTPTVLPITGTGSMQPGSDDLLSALISAATGAGIAAFIICALLLLRARRF